jgi:membrane-associated phospholipid phosphatase
MASRSALHAQTTRSRLWRDACSFLAQMGLVAGVDLSDELFHVLHGPNDVPVALANATQIMRLESTLGVWLEPALQTALLRMNQSIPQLVPLFNDIYSLGYVLFTFCFALWAYWYRRPLFAFLRTVFLLTTALTVVVSEIVPLAPPRLAMGLRYQGRPFHFVDTVFGQGACAQLSFNQYAAMPSLHVAWALLVGLALVWLASPPVVRVLGALFPLIMLLTVIVTGNHYLLDGVGSLAVVDVAVRLAVAFEHRHAPDASLARPSGGCTGRTFSAARCQRHPLRRPRSAAEPVPCRCTGRVRPCSCVHG